MKTDHLKPIHSMHSTPQTCPQLNSAIVVSTTASAHAAASPSGPRHVFKLGLDVDLNFVVTALQCDHGAIKPAQKWTRAQLIHWVKQQVAVGHTVHTVYECCGFGYTLHEALAAAGAHSLVTTPRRLSPERRRKNDRLDARQLCVRLSRHLDGHAHELRPVRIPTREEQQRRETGRQREFWKRELRRLENHGRALRLEFEHQTLPAGWAGRGTGNGSPRSVRSLCARSWHRWWRNSARAKPSSTR
jgi:rRNA maturation protein Nop10